MAIGYACQTLAVPDTDLKHCLAKHADELTLAKICSYNLKHLDNVLDYAIENEIKLFRISSDIIPFGSSRINTLHWWKQFETTLQKLGSKIQKTGMRVSMHPGQYTILNSPHEEVVENSLADLNYHSRFLDSLSLGTNHKLILHIGGVYGDKKAAMQRFIEQYHNLDQKIRSRLVLENDDRSYTIEDILYIFEKTGAPVVFDNLHHAINPSETIKSESNWIATCAKTWKESDGRQKIHYSQQAPGKKPGAHSSTIKIDTFLEFYTHLENKDIDIMLEVKDKNLSALKCINCLSPFPLATLTQEWQRYRHLVLEHGQDAISRMYTILDSPEGAKALDFYRELEKILAGKLVANQVLATTTDIFQAIEKYVTQKEKQRFLVARQRFKENLITLASLKKTLQTLCKKYQSNEMLSTYYFL